MYPDHLLGIDSRSFSLLALLSLLSLLSLSLSRLDTEEDEVPRLLLFRDGLQSSRLKVVLLSKDGLGLGIGLGLASAGMVLLKDKM